MVFSTIFLACIVISLSLYSMAMDWNEVNVVFIDDTSFTEYEQQIIIDYLTGEKNSNVIYIMQYSRKIIFRAINRI